MKTFKILILFILVPCITHAFDFEDGLVRQYKKVITLPAANSNIGSYRACLTEYQFGTEVNGPLDLDGTHPCQSNGYDIRFTDAAETVQYPMELVRVTPDNTPSSADAEVYVYINDSYSTSAKEITMWWSTTQTAYLPDYNSDYGTRTVWSGYKTIHHFEQSGLWRSLNTSATSLWLANKRIQTYNNKTYFTFLDVTNGDIYITYFDLNTKEWATPHNIAGTATPADGHMSPVLLVTSTGYICVSWTDYNVSPYRTHFYISTNTEDITAWESDETPVTGSSGTNYPTLFEIGGDIVLMVKTDTGTLKKIVRSSGSWGSLQTLFATTPLPNRIYYEIIKGTSDRLHLGYHFNNEGDGGSSPNYHHDIYYAYCDDAESATSIWKTADGTTLTLPMDEDSANKIFDTSDNGWDNSYFMSLGADANNVPHLVFSCYDSVATNTLNHAYYSGAAWNFGTIMTDNDCVYNDGKHCDGDIYVESSSKINIALSIIESTYIEIEEWQTTNTGSSWSKLRDITSSSSAYNVMPTYSADLDDGIINECRLFYFTGSTDDFRDPKTIKISPYGDNYTATEYTPEYFFATSDYYTDSLRNYIITNTSAPSTVQGNLGTCLDFNGTSNYITFDDELNTSTDDFSVQTQIKFDTVGAIQWIANNRTNSLGYYMLQTVGNPPTCLGFLVRDTASTTKRAETASLPSVDTWVHFSGVRDIGTGLKVFLDGGTPGTDSDTGVSADNNLTRNFTLGRAATDVSGSYYYFNGQMELFRLYDGIISDDYIDLEAANYSSPSTFGSSGTTIVSGGISQIY